MVIHRVYDEILRSWSHVAVLRAILDTRTGYSGNQVARLSGMHARSALKALTSLERLGVVWRQRGGRDHLFTLNRAHFLVREGLIGLYDSEHRFREAIYDTLADALRKHVVSALIFGSVARNQESPESDLDICLIVSTEQAKESVRNVLSTIAPGLIESFGIRIAPVFLSVAELWTQKHRGFVRELVAEGKSIVGRDLKVLIHAKAQKSKNR